MPPLRIASLGSSFAAGPGVPPVSDAKAARSSANYARLLSARLGGASGWEPSAGYGMGAEQPWVSGWSWRSLYAGGAYHPNAEGMAAAAEMIHEKLLGLGISAADHG
ncbi:SGNH hydrolase [Apiospora rasikravindrae]|uniref:SGNH hydrolase n=1 Tax=Apiospora rasikravindrae TaxID=990691 RepID=A0ABR1T084_9PEZI